MAKAQPDQRQTKERRKAVLSPELNEFLHMLKALEGEFIDKASQPT